MNKKKQASPGLWEEVCLGGSIVILFPSQAAGLHEPPTIESDLLNLLIAHIPVFIGLGASLAPERHLAIFPL